MSRNKLAGKSTGKSESAKYLASHPEARKKKQAYDKKFHATPERIKYRTELGKARRKAGVYGKGGKDMSHTKDGTLVPEAKSKNRARNGKNGKSTKK